MTVQRTTHLATAAANISRKSLTGPAAATPATAADRVGEAVVPTKCVVVAVRCPPGTTVLETCAAAASLSTSQ